MARTPFMSMLRLLAADHAEAERRGLPVEQIRVERGYRRRDFLKLAGALVGGTLIHRPHPLFASTPAPRIAIIGGGVSGLNAALTLHDAGYATTLYESASNAGGRIHSDTSWANGQVSEWCGELIDSGHASLQGLAARFGLTLDDLHAAEPPGSTDTYYFAGNYYSYAEADLDFVQVLRILNQQNDGAPFPTLYNSYTPMGRYLDSLSVYQWIEKYVPGGHRSKLGMLLDVAYDIEYGAPTTQQSSLNIVYLLPGPTDDLALFGASDERYHIRGGNQQLQKAIAAHLPKGTIRFNHRLEVIAKHHDGSIRLSFRAPAAEGGTHTVVADRVILALPFSVLRNLDYSKAGFDALKTTAIRRLGYGTNAKLMLQFVGRAWTRPGPWGLSNGTSFADTGYQNSWDVTRAQPGSTGILVDYLGSRGASIKPDQGAESHSAASPAVRAYAKTFLRQVEPVYPGLSYDYADAASLSSPKDNPNLRGSYSFWRVGQYTRFSGYEGARQGRIHFAGEHCSTGFQGYMEGGAEQGARAAQEIIDDHRAGVFP